VSQLTKKLPQAQFKGAQDAKEHIQGHTVLPLFHARQVRLGNANLARQFRLRKAPPQPVLANELTNADGGGLDHILLYYLEDEASSSPRSLVAFRLLC
jgi:hypothetical protein